MRKLAGLTIFLMVLCSVAVAGTTFMTPKNFITVHLAADIDDDDTSMTVETGEGATLPAHPFPLVIDSEIVLITEIATDTLTITRAQEDTVAAAHEDGANCYLNITAKYVSDLNTATNTLEGYFTSGKCNVANGGTGAATAAAACSALGVGAEDSPQFTAATLGATGSAGLLTWTNGLTEGSYATTTMDYADALLLNDITGLAVTDSNVIVGNGLTWVAESGDTLRTSLGLAIGTNVQAYDAQLADIAGLAVTDGNIIVGDGTHWVAESGATLRTTVGVGTGDSPQFTGVTATGTATIDTLNVGGGSGGSGVSITNAGAITADALINASGKINSAAGTAAAPSIYMNGDTDTGIYQSAANEIGLSIEGVLATKLYRSALLTLQEHYDVLNQPYGPVYKFMKARGTNIITSGDRLGAVSFAGYDGDSYADAAYIFCHNDAAPGNGDMAGRVSIWTSPDGSETPAEALRVASNKLVTCYDDLYVTDNCSALTYTDRTPAYDGDALGDIAKIKADANGKIDHATLPEFARKKIKHTETAYGPAGADGKPTVIEEREVEEDGRDLGAMISVLTVAVQQLTKQNEEQQCQIDDLLKRVEKLEKK